METTLNLVVIRAADLERSQRFYEALGLRFSRERHGSGPEHLAAELGGMVFEIYPRGSGPATVGVRLGFQVASVETAISAVQQLGAEVATPPAAGPWGWRAVVIDPDGLRVEVSQASE
jgi:predicted enzyme related to lactoylglutathione lyase